MKAQAAFLTAPAPGIVILNIKRVGQDVERVELTQAQLANIIVDGAAMALRSAGIVNHGERA